MNLNTIFGEDYTLIKEMTLPMLMLNKRKKVKDKETKKNKYINSSQLMTINNFATIHWSDKSKIKNEYKDLLKSWFIDGQKLPEDIIFVWEPTYADARRRDSINIASISKIVEDIFVEQEALVDDNQTSHVFLSGSIDKNLNEHKLNLRIFGKET